MKPLEKFFYIMDIIVMIVLLLLVFGDYFLTGQQPGNFVQLVILIGFMFLFTRKK